MTIFQIDLLYNQYYKQYFKLNRDIDQGIMILVIYIKNIDALI